MSQYVLVFRYKWFRVGSDLALVGPLSEEEATTTLSKIASEKLCDYDVEIMPFESADSVLEILRKQSAKVAAEEAEELARRQGQLTIDEIIIRCSTLPNDLPVVVVTETKDSPYDGMTIDYPGSYRGSYDELVLIPKSDGLHTTLVSFKKMIQTSIGGEFYGHKGGTYIMYGNTYVWLSDYGISSGLAVVDVRLSADNKFVEIFCKSI